MLEKNTLSDTIWLKLTELQLGYNYAFNPFQLYFLMTGFYEYGFLISLSYVV